MLNSCYGKLIERAHDVQTRVVRRHEGCSNDPASAQFMDDHTATYLEQREFVRKSFIEWVGRYLVYDELDIKGAAKARGV